jgi:hypothetical protein
MRWIEGRIVSGYGVASGRAGDARFPQGTIRMQLPHFLERGIDLSPYFPGTLNVDVTPAVPTPKGDVFDGLIHWHAGFNERFLLSSVEIEVKGSRHAGLWYYPHPDTKTDHFQQASVMELLLPWIDGSLAGETVRIRF